MQHMTALILLIHVLLASTVLLYGALQQRILPVLQPYIPAQLGSYLPQASQDIHTAASTGVLSPDGLLEACEMQQYTTEIISLDPLLIYINNFTSAQEAEELINLGCVSIPS